MIAVLNVSVLLECVDGIDQRPVEMALAAPSLAGEVDEKPTHTAMELQLRA